MAKLLTNTRIYGTGTVDTQLFVKGFQSVHSTATGALQVSGGIGVAGGAFFSGVVTATSFIGSVSGASGSLAGGTAGQIPYQISAGLTGFFGPGTSGDVLTSAGGGQPVFVGTTTLYVGNAVTATNVRGGLANQFIYQSAPGITAFVNTGSMYVGRSTLSDNLAGGLAGQFVYQSAPNTTAFINTSSMYVGRAVIADSVAGGTGFINTVQQTTNAAHYLTFVDSNNASSTAENVYTSSSFVVNPGTGNVGIGTASPATSLHISSAGTAKLRISADTDNITEADVAGIELSQDGGITTANFGIDDNNYLVIGANSTTAPNIYIGTRSDGNSYVTAADARITILNGGNVGIGVNPSYKLDVDGVVQGRQGLRTGLGYNTYISDRLQFAASTGFGHHQFKQVDPGSGTTRLDLRRYTGSGDGFDGGEMITFLNNGNVGIGTTSPARKLQVAGDITVNSVYKDFQVYSATTNNLTRTWDGVLVAGSDSGSAETYTVIETAVPQDSYMMGGFTIDWFESYGSTNGKTSIQLGGYWNAESNGGFIGWEYTSTNPNIAPTIQVARKSSNGMTVIILTHFSPSYPIIVARDLWLGYSTGAETYGTGWAILQTSSLAAYTNFDTVIARTALPSGTISGTQNYVAKFTSANSLGSSQIFDNGTQVGLNTTDFSYTASDNTPVIGSITNNRFFVNGSVQLLGNNDAIVFGRGTSTFLKDEELGFGWGGGWYMEDTTWVKVRNNKNIYTTGIIRSDGDMRAPIFYDQDNTGYYTNPASNSQLYGLRMFNNFDTASSDVYASMRVIRNGNSGSLTDGMYIGYGNSGGGVTRIYGGGATSTPLEKYSGYSFEPGSFRAPIFYDSDNTSYYADPASTSNFNQLQVQGFNILQTLSISVTAGNWYTIATNPGNRCYATFYVWDYDSGLHGSMSFNAGVSYNSVATITMLGKSWYSGGGNFNNIRIRGSTTYDPQYLQIYANYTGTMNIAMQSNFQSAGWTLTNGGTGSPGASTFAEVDPNSYAGLATNRNIWSGDSIYAGSSMRAPIFYDTNNTGYYVDPASSTVLNTVYAYDWFRTYDEEGLYSQSYGQHFYPSSGGAYWNITSNSSSGGITVRASYAGSIKGYIGYWDSNGFGHLSGGSWWLNDRNGDPASLIIGGYPGLNAYGSVTSRRLMFGGGDSDAYNNYYIGTNLENYGGNYNKLDLRWHTGIRMGAQPSYGGIRFYDTEDLGTQVFAIGKDGSYAQANQSMRAPIFYDLDNTSYYIDPTSTTAIRTVGSWRADSSSWDGEFSGKMQYHSNHWYVQYADLFILRNSGGSNVWYANQSGTMYAPFWYDTNNTGYYVDPNSTSNVYAMVAYSLQGNGNVGGTGSASWHPSGIYSAGYNWLYGGINGGANSATNFSDVRANIFYDYNNTGYYLDPASTSELNKVYYNSNMVARNYGIGQVGIYTSVRYQAVWSMGESYLLPADGTSTGNLYGIAWSHPNAGGIAGNLASHGMLILENGSFQGAWGGGSLRTPSDIRGTIFYDWNDTGYYLDPHADRSSNINGFSARTVEATKGTYKYNTPRYIHTSDTNYWVGTMGWGQTDFNSVMTWGSGFFDTWSSPANSPGDTSHWVGVQAYHYVNAANSGYGWQLAGGVTDSLWWRHSWPSNSGWFKVAMYNNNVGTGDFYATIYYDSNNTGYYLDPASTSQLHYVLANNWFRAQGDSGFYTQDYGGHFRRSLSASHGTWEVFGYNKGGYAGINIIDPQGYWHNYMHESGNGGLYQENNGGKWVFYYSRGNNCLGIGSNATVSGYACRINDSLYVNSTMYAGGAVYGTIFYDSNDSGYYSNPNDTSVLNYTLTRRVKFIGEGGNSGMGTEAYAIFQEGGSWSFPYPDLRIAFHTGIKLGGNAPSYEGTRVYSDYDMSDLCIQLAGGSNYSYKYKWQYTNTTGYYSDTNGWHIHPNDLSSYGGTALRGSRNGWRGIHFHDGGGTPHLMFDGGGNGGIYHESAGRWAMYYSYGNNSWGFGSSSTSSSHRIYIADNSFIANMYANGFYYASDRKLKENIHTIDNALETIGKLRGVSYNKIADPEKKKEIGVIAQEVQAVIPALVVSSKDDKEQEYLSVNYGNFAGLFIEAFKEQTAIINSLKEEIAELKAKLGV